MADEELDGIDSEEEAGLSDSNVTEQESEESAQDAGSQTQGFIGRDQFESFF